MSVACLECALSICLAPGAIAAAKEVLILSSFESDAVTNAVTGGTLFRSELERRFDGELSFTEMDLEPRWGIDDQEPIVAELLRQRERALPLDLVFAEGPQAISFWLRFRDRVAPNAPLVATARKWTFERTDFREGDVGIWSDFSFGAALADILTVLPATDRVLIVLGSTERERGLARQARRELADQGNISFEYSNDYTLRELQRRVRSLEPPSAIYIASFNTDINGAVLRWHAALSIVHSMSRVPVFGPFDDQLGRGIVGGRLIPLTSLGQMTADAAIDLLQGRTIAQRWQVLPLTPPTYDWRELQRWSLDSSVLPPGSEVRYAPTPVWQRYPVQTAVVLAFVVAQSLLLVGLLVQRQRARSAERSETRLAGMLIDAHEVERRRIARELHDDFSQRLAGLAIDAGMLSRTADGGPIRDRLAQLETGIGSLSEDVHDLSYRLHPSIVDDLGIVTALQTECDRVRQHSDARIVEDIRPLEAVCPRDTALCIYRVCQEALANASHYAKANTIEVQLLRRGSVVVLQVRDDGCGFDPRAHDSGLGLSSMRERTRLLGGALVVDSARGHGTTIRATLPIPGTAPATTASAALTGAEDESR